MGQQLLPVLSVGGAGAIDGLAGIFPKSVVKLYDLYTSGGENKREELRKLQYKISTAEELIVKHGVPGIKEGVRRVLGIGVEGAIRLPHVGGVSDKEFQEFEHIFEELKVIESP
jgi:2-keto-3-deoxy-L-rhamnonate aldolase